MGKSRRQVGNSTTTANPPALTPPQTSWTARSAGPESQLPSHRARVCIEGQSFLFCFDAKLRRRSVEGSQLSRAEKRLWKRVWWTLFTRDRSVAVALGRPIQINLDDTDVEMITEDDFVEDEPNRPAEYPPNSVHVQFFLQYVRLCEILGLVLSRHYSVASRTRWQNYIEVTQSALADWLQRCPKEMSWDKGRHQFWSALLRMNY